MIDTRPRLEVRQEDKGTEGVFFHEKDGKRLAVLTYFRLGPSLLEIEHTEVDDSLRGTGAGRQLLDAAVAFARATQAKIQATCPYAKSQFDKDQSLGDVRA